MPISEVFCVDCLDYMRSIPDKYFDLAVVDPPYGLPKTSTHGRGKLKGRILNREDIHGWDIAPGPEYFDELRRVSKNQIIWGGNYFPLPPTRCVLVWDKVQPWENFSQVELAWTSFNGPAQIFRFDNRSTHKTHPTEKPVALYSWIFKKFGGGRKYLILTSVVNLQGLLLTMPDLTFMAAKSTPAISKVAAPASIKSVAALRTSTATKSSN